MRPGVEEVLLKHKARLSAHQRDSTQRFQHQTHRPKYIYIYINISHYRVMTRGTRPVFYIFLLLNKLVRQCLKPRAAPASLRKGSAHHIVHLGLVKGSHYRT